MSDLSLPLQSASGQLPVSFYFDDALYQREIQTLFRCGPRYVGHALSVPQVGDYAALPQENEGRALVHGASGIELVSNVCRHRQAIMLKGRGSLAQANGNIVCPIHRWTYSGSGAEPVGTLLGAPHFAHNPCLNLHSYPLQEWHGLLFEAAPANGAGERDVAADLAGLHESAAFDFSAMVLDRVELHECNYNWKTFIEVYLEDYHVGPFHPGLGHFVTCADLRWQFNRHCSVQTVGISDSFGRPGSAVYRRWHDALLKFRGGILPERGAIWLTYYPHIMVEWYPHVLTVSTLHPKGVGKTLNMVEFYYPEEIQSFERELVESQQAAYMETCREDDEIGERMDAGRRALLDRGDNQIGPCQSPMEDGMQHFHAWYRQQMGL
ncbi:MAG: aromatic ring-hydroxylating dioxygenase subunit alpha [Rhodoferax sp.]|jgi:choline monooxygenase|nr:aromatic ring-hydroxylating dioxygenase subunit alpha [Rhodoferax sp.]